jgi:hypothetical protein
MTLKREAMAPFLARNGVGLTTFHRLRKMSNTG